MYSGGETTLYILTLGSIWNYSRLAIHPRGTISDKGLYSGKSVKFASLQLFNFPIFMVWVVVPYLQ